MTSKTTPNDANGIADGRETRGTPRIWAVHKSYDGLRVRQYLGMGSEQSICTVSPAKTPAEQAANARLIASAPELLKALRNLAGNTGALRAFEHEIRDAAGNTNWQCLMDAIAEADAAIAKATAPVKAGA